MTRSPPFFSSRRRVRTPTLLQMEVTECGAAALGIILAHHGRAVPLEQLRDDCGVSRDGSKLLNVIKAARQHGLEAHAYKMEPAGLRELPLPVMVFWEFNHFVVVEGSDARGYYINDPATGPRHVTSAEFDAAFTGVVATFQPAAAFARTGRLPGFWSLIRPRLGRSQAPLVYILLAGLLLVLPGILIPSFSRIFVDHCLMAGHQSWVKPLLLGMLLTAVLRAATEALQCYHLARLETKLAIATTSRFFWRVLRLPMQFFAQRFAGELSYRVSLNDDIAILLSNQVATAFLSAATALLFAVLMFAYSAPLALVVFVFAALSVGVYWLSCRRLADESQRLLCEQGKAFGAAASGLLLVENLKAAGREADFFARWSGLMVRAANTSMRFQVLGQLLGIGPGFLQSLSMAVVLCAGGYLVVRGDLTVGMLVAFQSLSASFLAPVGALVGLGSDIQRAKANLRRLEDVCQQPLCPETAAAEAAPAAGPVVKLRGTIELRGVTFGYNRLEAPLITGLSLQLPPGARVALVGGSGSGKTTIARLVAGLYQPWSGEILFDGRPRPSHPRAVLNASIAIVDQDIFLFAGAVRENLTLWDDSLPQERVIQAARDAAIHDQVLQRPGGYESAVAENGANFSGGERQRLEIARALAMEPSLLILDEATSALDPSTEKWIDHAVRRRGCTCLIIAHRLSTIRDCDEILVLDGGRIVQRGTHEEMKTAGGPYLRLIEAE